MRLRARDGLGGGVVALLAEIGDAIAHPQLGDIHIARLGDVPRFVAFGGVAGTHRDDDRKDDHPDEPEHDARDGHAAAVLTGPLDLIQADEAEDDTEDAGADGDDAEDQRGDRESVGAPRAFHRRVGARRGIGAVR
ncbi:Uncharacterised protein [Mycobacteroides abscessus subsp. abscessus]|nr:Uncharacterised protein [Mycobacteroides abscessus subsp. abscessus]